MDWWKKNNLRMVQLNLRETDARLDVPDLVRRLKDMDANALMMNTGGIVAFYPTGLDCHWRNPHLLRPDGTVRDLVGEVVTACHAAGIRYIARFDFSKADAAIHQAHPEWFYQNGAGETMRFNGTVATCVNGLYQQDKSLDILREALTRYPIDGVFFNMFGYQTRDYSGRVFGLCRCEACRQEFHGMYGLALPADGEAGDPAWPAYRQFQHRTTRRMLERIAATVKGIRPDIAISTYDEHCVDVVRKESNTELDRPYPLWLYDTSENVQSVADAWADKQISNCCINAVGLDVRFMGVSPHLTRTRLLGSLAAGSGLDFCIIGNFPDYPDPAGPAVAAEVFRFAAAHEREYGCFASVAAVALVKPDRFAPKSAMDEYRGLFRAMKERHLIFDVLHAEHLAEGLRRGRERLQLLVLPALPVLDEDAAAVIRQMHREGVQLLATGRVPAQLAGTVFPFAVGSDPIPSRSAYLDVAGEAGTGEHAREDRRMGSWVFLAGEVFPARRMPQEDRDGAGVCRAVSDAPGAPGDWHIATRWPILSAGRYGPPEKCGGHGETGEYGLYQAQRDGCGSVTLLPWHPGTLFLRHGHTAHRDLVTDAIDAACGGDGMLETDAPACVEVFLHRHGSGGWMLQLINHSGFNGITFEAPLPIHDVRVTLRLPEMTEQCRAYSLYREDNVRLALRGTAQEVEIRIPLLDVYEGIRIV